MTLSIRTLVSTFFLATGCLLLVLALGCSPANAQMPDLEWGKIGVAGGANLELVNDLESNDVTASFGSETGYHFGVTYDQPLGAVYVRPGFIVRRAGTFTFPSSFDGPSHTLLEGKSFTVWVFEVPVDVRYQYELGDVASIYAFGGPTAAFPRAKQDFDRSFPNVTLAAEGGIGGEFKIPNVPLIVSPEVRYSYSITNTVKKDFQLRGHSFQTDGLNLTGPSFRLHVYYPLDF